MMKILKWLGVLIFIVSLFCALCLAGRIETEDADFRAGEITQAEMMSNEQMWKDVAAVIGIAVAGGFVYSIGAVVESAKEKREERKRWFDDDEDEEVY